MYIYDTRERHTTSCPNTFIKKNDALLSMVRKKSREEREREEEHWRFEEEKRNEREKRDGTTEEKKDFALHGFRTLDDVPEWYRAPRDVAVVLEL